MLYFESVYRFTKIFLFLVYHQTCFIWDINTRTSQTADHSTNQKLAKITYVTISSDQSLFAIGTIFQYITIWNLETISNEITFKTEGTDWWITLAFSPHNLLLAAGSDESKILILDLQNQKRNVTIQYSKEQTSKIALQIQNECTALVFSSDALQLAAGNNKGNVWIFNIKTREQLFYLDTQTTEKIQKIVFLNNNQNLIIANSDTKYHYNLMSEPQQILISKEENKDLYTQDSKLKDIFVTEQNLVLVKLQNDTYSLVYQIVDSIDKTYMKLFKFNNFILLSFNNTGYILHYLE